MKEKDIKQIRLSSLKKDRLNVFKVDEELNILVFYDGENIRVIQDLCPHMGGSLANGQLCQKNGTIVCPWHGYEFCASELVLKENPNENTWIKPLAGDEFETYKTPRYKLRKVEFRIENEFLYIQQ